MREMPQPQQPERARDPIEGLFDQEKISILPPDRQRIIRQLLDCFKKLKEGTDTDEDREFIRSIFSILEEEAQGIADTTIVDFETEGGPQLPLATEKLSKALNDLYLLLLTSLPAEELDEKIQRELMRIKTSDFERIMQIWEAKRDGIKFSYGVEGRERPEAMETKTEIKGEQQEARIETDKGGFLYVFKPDHNFWRALFLLGREEKEAEFNRILTEAILRFRQLSERLSKIKLPKEIREILLEEDENKRNEKINQLSEEEDKALVMMILNIQRNFLETFQKIAGIKSHEKEFSAEDLEKLNQELRNLKKEADDYEEAIKKLEERFGTTYQPDNELAKKFLKKTSQWIKENFPTIGLTLGASLVLWGVALGWFLPLWLINKMKDEIEKGLK
jgi:hypothetical protein